MNIIPKELYLEIIVHLDYDDFVNIDTSYPDYLTNSDCINLFKTRFPTFYKYEIYQYIVRTMYINMLYINKNINIMNEKSRYNRGIRRILFPPQMDNIDDVFRQAISLNASELIKYFSEVLQVTPHVRNTDVTI